jgi:diguanylate cyclase (GGDEF)-like protein
LNPDETQQLIVDESPAARQLRAGFPWLRFEPELEREFRREHARARLQQIRFNVYLAIALTLAFAGFNTLLLEGAAARTVLALQFGLLLPVLVAAAAIAHRHDGPSLFMRSAPVLVPLGALVIVAIELTAAKHGVQLLFSTVVLTALFAYFLAGLMFYEAVRANAIVLVAYFAFGFVAGLKESEVVFNTLVLIAANLVGATVAYGVETLLRTHFLEARLLSETAARDGLTGLYNRRRFDEHLEQNWEQAQREGVPLALLLVDIDFFKRFNDRHGHQAGDECLKAVAASLARAARRPLDFVARYGGEEFAVVLYEPSREYVREVAHRIHASVATRAIPHGDSPVAASVTVSIGVAYVAPSWERSSSGFVQLADEALYEAKNQGRNRSVFRELEYAELQTGSFRASRRGVA